MAADDHVHGKYYQEFREGESLISPGRTITESDIQTFAGLSADFNPLHTDKEYAKDNIYQGRIAHGLLIVSIVSGLAARLGFSEGTALALTKIEWRFKAPVKIGDTIRAQFTVKRKKKVQEMSGGFIEFGVEVFNQEGEKVQHGTWTTLMKSKPGQDR